MSKINENNWNFAQYTNNNLKAIIGLGASPEQTDNQFIYFATVLDEENNEHHQVEFNELKKACDYLNQKYQGLWEFNDLSISKDTGGCSTCSAH